MVADRSQFEPRFLRVVIAVHWAALLLGITVSALDSNSPAEVVAAALIAGSYVVALQATPVIEGERWMGELLVLGGAATAAVALGLTDGVNSPYILFSLLPTMLAAGLLGTRIAVEIAIIAVAALVIVASLLDQSLLSGPLLATAGLQLVVALVLSQARRVLVDQRARTESILLASAETEARMARLQAAHDLLLRLSGVADAAELNPVNVGRQALDNLSDVVKYDAALVAINGDDGPVVVARDAEEAMQHHRTTFPLSVSGRDVGFVVLSRGTEFEDDERDSVAAAVRPVALAFSNVLLLREIARRAVKEERVRLARELHDEIGPSLASVGLALDLALLQYPTEPELGSHLQDLRGSVTKLVDEIRNTVTDLREEGGRSLIQRVRAIGAALTAERPALRIDLDERRPPRPAVAGELSAILTEAVRNAIEHSEAEHVTVGGYVDHDRGAVTVTDDGRGFDQDTVAGGHFGLLGMAERAKQIGASVKVTSVPGEGTSVEIRWGPR